MPELKTIGIALLSSTQLYIGSSVNGTKIDLYAVPGDKDCIITDVVLRNPSGTLAGCVDVDFGTGAACATISFLNNETGIADMTATDDCMHLVNVSNDYKVIDGSSDAVDRTFGIYVVAGATAATATVYIEVFGYLFTRGSGA